MFSDTSLLNHLPGGVIITDAQEYITFVNRYIQDWLGYAAEDMLGKSPQEFMDGAGKIMLQTQKQDQTNIGLDSYIVPFNTKAGHKIWTKMDIKPAPASNGETPGKIVYLQDYTHCRQQHEQVEALFTQLVKSENELKEMIYIISHDVRAPIRGINSLVDWVCKDYKDALDGDGIDQLNLIKSRVLRLDGLLEGILTYSRILNKVEQKADVNLEDMATGVCDTLENTQAVAIAVNLKNKTLWCEVAKTRAIFEQLIKNAIENMDKTNGQVEVGMDEHGYYVKDDGPGIPPKDHDEIFKLFKTLNKKDKNDSAGVGLTLTRKCVEIQGGKIWIESNGRGTAVRFTIPNNKPPKLHNHDTQ